MQPLTAAPRTQYTVAQMTALLQAPDLEVDYGVELLSNATNLVDSDSSTFPTGVGLWGNNFLGGTACAIAGSSVHAATGATSMLITWPTAAATMTAAVWPTTLVIGVRYTFAVQVFVPTGSPPVRLLEVFGGQAGYAASTLTDAWERLEITFTADKTAYFFGVATIEASTAGQQCWVDDFRGAVGGAMPVRGEAIDISEDVSGGKVSRDCLADIHGTCELTISRELAWGRDQVRPFMLLSSASVGVSDVRWTLGVYLLLTPVSALGENPRSWQATGYDRMHLLMATVGDSYAVAGGTNVLDAIRKVFVAARITSPILIDSSAGSKFLGTPRTWPLTSSESPTWIQILNDLCKAIGYRAIWVDADGKFRVGPYVLPSERAVEWELNVGDISTGIVAAERTVTRDLWGVANWYRYIRNDLPTPPVEGNGRYTVTNASAGPSSVASVGRIVRSPVVFLDATSQGDLVSQGNRLSGAAMRVSEVIDLKMSPWPCAGHFDRFELRDKDLGSIRQCQARSWELPLDGSDMTMTLETI